MAISFPTSPSANDTYTIANKTWKYNGYAWDLVTVDLGPFSDTSNGAYAVANAAFTVANSAYTNANATLILAQAAFDRANLSNDILFIESSYNTANAAYDKANAANVLAYNTGIGANAWSNTKLANTDGAVFEGTLNIKNNVFIGGSVTNVTQLMFNTSTNIVPATPGALTWSQDDSTLRFDMDTPSNVIQHIGQDLFYLVKNQTGSSIAKGTVVRFAGTLGASGRLLIAPAIANNSYPSKYIMGVAAATINNGDDGYVLAQGKLKQVDTSAFSDGDVLYVSPSTPGAFSNTMPSAPNNKVTVAAVVHSDVNGTLQVRVTLGSKINEDELAEINGLAEGDVLAYVNANGRFENKNTLVSAYNSSNAGYVVANAAFDKANAANVLAYNTGIGANNYAGAMANSGNAWTQTIVDANLVTARAYTNTSTTAANNYAGAMANSSNAYATDTYATITTVATNATSSNNYAGVMANGAGTIANAAFAAANQAGVVANNANTYAGSTYVKKAGDTVTGDFVIQGNLTISGNTTYANTQTLLIGDAIITLNNDIPVSVAPSEDAGIEVKRGSSANVSVLWREGNDTWTLTKDGTTWYEIATNTDITSANNYAGAMANAANAVAATKVASVTGTAGQIFSSGGTTPTVNLISTGVTATTYGGSTQIPVIAVDAYGRLTSASNVAVNGMDYPYVNTSTAAANNWANTKVGAVTSNGAGRLWANTVTDAGGIETVYVDLSTSGVTATTYGGATQIPVLTVDAYGRITGASNVAVSGMDYAYVNTSTAAANNYAGVMANSANAVAATKVATVSGTSGRITSSGTTGITLDLATAGAGAASYSTGISAITVDAYGRVTSVTGSAGYVTSSGVTSVATGVGLTGGTITSTGTLALATYSSGSNTAVSGGISSITVDEYGRVRAVSGSAGYSTTTGTVTSVATGTGLTGGTITTTGTISLATAGAGAATYSSGISAITVDAYGRVTSVTGSANYVVSGGALGTPSSGTLTNCTIPWSGVTGEPTTLSGYGITDGVTTTVAATALAATEMTVTSLSDASGTISWDASTSRMATVTLSGIGRTMANPTNLKAGSYIFIVKQDATGSRTITSWGTAFKWPAAVAPTLSTTASTTDVFSFWCDGTNLYGTYIPDCR